MFGVLLILTIVFLPEIMYSRGKRKYKIALIMGTVIENNYIIIVYCLL